MIFNVMLYGLHLPVRNLARLNKDGQSTFYRASLHPTKENPDEGWVSLSLAPVAVACILDGITVAGREGRIVISCFARAQQALCRKRPLTQRQPSLGETLFQGILVIVFVSARQVLAGR